MAPIRLALFSFVIRHMGRLRRFSVLTHAFDLFLYALTFITAPVVVREIRVITREATRWHGVIRKRHRLGGREFDDQDAELGHVHSNGVVDVKLTRPEHDDVLSRGLAQPHHVAPQSSWVTFVIEKADDARGALTLLAIAHARIERGDMRDVPTEENG